MGLEDEVNKEVKEKPSFLRKLRKLTRNFTGAAYLAAVTALISPTITACGEFDPIETFYERVSKDEEESGFRKRRFLHLGSLSGKKCGGSIPCSPGDIIVRDTVLTYDLGDLEWNTNKPVLTLTNGAKIDCQGHIIGVHVNNNGEYKNNRTAIWIKYDSKGSSVVDCRIHGFRKAIYAELDSVWTKDDAGKIHVEYKGIEDIFIGWNEILVGSGECQGSSCGSSQGVEIQGWPGVQKPPKNILIFNNYFDMAKSPKSDKDSFLHYGSYIVTTSAKNFQVWFNTFENLHWGRGARLLYDTDSLIVGNKFTMPWERNKLTTSYKSCIKKGITPYQMPSGWAIDVFNGKEYGHPKINAWFNLFRISEDPSWPPSPYSGGPSTGLNHEHVIINASLDPFAPSTSLPPFDLSFNRWENLNGTPKSDAEIRRVVYDKNYTVGGVKVEPNYREVIWKPRIK